MLDKLKTLLLGPKQGEESLEKASGDQMALLFDAPVDVHGYTTKRGTYVAPHRSRRKKSPDAAPAHDAHPEVTAEAARKRQVVTLTNPRGVLVRPTGFYVAKDGEAVQWFHFRERADERARKVGGQVVDAADVSFGTASAPKPEEAVQQVAAAPVEPPSHLAPEPTRPVERPKAFGADYDATPAQRRADNAAALKVLEKDDSQITDADRAVLAKYSGTGGIGDSLNEFYTRPDVAEAMWAALARLGLPGGSVLEPSCGTGVFLHTAPEDIKVTGVELDETSSRIARLVHPQHEVQRSSLEAFATADVRLFDGVVGNPPFGLRGSFLSADKDHIPRAEQYFLDTALDKTREGGIVALVLPSGVMDASSARARRKEWLCKGEFLGAVRMPNTAFKHSQTEVTTDVVFFRRRAPDVAQALLTLDDERLKSLGVLDPEFIDGGYFEGRGAARVMGVMEAGWRAKAGIGDDITVEGSMEGVADAIRDFQPEEPAKVTMADVLASAGEDATVRDRAMRAALKPPYEYAKVGDTKTVNGVVYILQGDPPRWHRVDDAEGEPEHVTEGRQIGAAIEQLASGTADREAVHGRLKEFVAKHGNPRTHADITSRSTGDKHLHRLMSAVQPDGSFSDLVTGARRGGEVSVEAVADRLSLAGTFTPAQLARETGGDPAAVEDMLHASERYALVDHAGGTWQSMDQYLTGELWPKLDGLRKVLEGDLDAPTRARLEKQAAAVEKTIAPKALEDVEVELNSAWVPLDVMKAFFDSKVDAYLAEHPGASSWAKHFNVKFEKGAYEVHGGLWGDANLMGKYLNRTGLKEDDYPKIQALNKEFKDWLCTSTYREWVEDVYNRAYTGFVKAKYSEEAMEVPGLNPDFDVKSYHWAGLRWALATGKGIVAADVGLGKTGRALMLAKLLKVHGQAKKPIIAVPKSVLANWKAEVDNWFPGSKVLVIGETHKAGKDGKTKVVEDTKAVREQKLHDLAQNDYDFVLMSREVWNELDLSPIKKGEYVNDDFWVQRGDTLGNAGDKRINKIRTAYDQAVAGREFQKRTNIIQFEDLGVDAVILDEAHAYKNLYAARNRFGENPKFLGGSGLSNRALDTQFKTRYIREQSGGKNVFLLTATPTKNSPLEVYSMLAHVAPEAFERMGIRNSEEFLDRFCEFTKALTLGVDGQIEEGLITSGFKNLDELREVMKRYIDRTTAADVGLKLPKPLQQEHIVDMSPRQQKVYETLREQAAKSEGKEGEGHIFSIMDKMAKAAMDLELYDPAYRGEVSPKYTEVAKNVATGVKDGGQIVFIEHVDAHERVKDELVKTGIKPEEIAIINASATPSSSERQSVADRFNRGEIKVVIGNKTMEEGMNLQKQTADIHHLDIPWEPATLQQRNGRGVRQGNKLESIRLHRYVAKGSFDGYRYQTVAAKKDWQDQLWGTAKRVENLAAQSMLNREDMLIMLSADPEAARKKFLENKSAAEKAHIQQKTAEAAHEFVRFREMTRSHKALKDKNTKTAARLASQIDAARTRLQADKFFRAKDALDAPEDVLMHPGTGDIFKPGTTITVSVRDRQPLNLPEGDHKLVIEKVVPNDGTLRVRQFGSRNLLGALEVGKLADYTTGAYDPAEEQQAMSGAEIGKTISQVLAGFANSTGRGNAIETAVTEAMAAAGPDWHKDAAGRGMMWARISNKMHEIMPEADQKRLQTALEELNLSMQLTAHGHTGAKIDNEAALRGLPDAVLHEHGPAIQKHLKDLHLAYRDRREHGKIALLKPDGTIGMYESYETRDKLKDHDFVLPTEENKAKMIAAYNKAEEERRFGANEVEQRGGRRGGYSYRAPELRPGVKMRYGNLYSEDRTNPVLAAGNRIFDTGFSEAARAEMAKRSGAAALAAKTPADYVTAVLPSLPIESYSGLVPWKPEHVKRLAELGEQAGMLDKPLSEVLPKGLPTGLFDPPPSYSFQRLTGRHTLAGALKNLATHHKLELPAIAGKPKHVDYPKDVA